METDGPPPLVAWDTRQFQSKEAIMDIRFVTALAAASLAMSLGACSNMSPREKNTATGAAIGGVAGAVLTGGSAAGTVGGAAVGGVIGNQVDKK
jgi:osmotically inducible lipoprotein OsmB